jgi:hypothetical protein
MAASAFLPRAALAADSAYYTVVAEVLPIMESPGAKYEIRDGEVLWNEGVQGVVVYGNRLELRECSTEGWNELISPEDGSALGYVETSGVEKSPEYKPAATKYYMSLKDSPQLLLYPGEDKYDLSFYGYSLLKGEVLPSPGEREGMLLLEFGTVPGSGDGGVGARYAWGDKRDFISLESYEPDNSRIDPASIPAVMRKGDGGDAGKITEKVPSEMIARISKHGFAIDSRPVILEYISVDDMADSYRETGDYEVDFITTDIFLHSFHLIFEHMLQKLERVYLAPALGICLKEAMDSLERAKPDIPEGITPSYETARNMFAIAASLLADHADESEFYPAAAEEFRRVVAAEDMAAALLLNESGFPLSTAEEFCRAMALEGMAAALPLADHADRFGLSPAAAEEFLRVMTAEGIEESRITGQKIDYTMFKPRGHYTLIREFGCYFRAMSYIGTAELPLFDSSGKPIIGNVRTAALISLILDSLGERWESFEEPIGFLVGVPNSGDSKAFRALVRKHIGEPDHAASYKNLSDKAKILSLAEEISAVIRGPMIQSVVGVDRKDSDFANRDAVFRISGRRFTYDAYVMNMLASPRTGTDELPRNLPEGTDVMAVLGSAAADIYARKNYDVKNYRDNLEALKSEAAAYLSGERTVYSKWLSVFSSGFEDSGSKQFFYNAPAWQWKKLSTYLASWAELKHDTILYAEQSAAEMGDGRDFYAGRFAPPQPRGYVEPDPKAFDALLAATGELLDFIKKYGMEPPAPEDDYFESMDNYEKKLTDLSDILKKARDIAKKEVDGAEITREDYSAIKEIARGFRGEILLPGTGEFYGDDAREQVKMALVADVATDGISGACLEAASGTPRKIYAYVNDKSGGSRLTRGYIYSYYEFERSLSEGRMTDEEWKEIVYCEDRAEELERYRPAWYRELER